MDDIDIQTIDELEKSNALYSAIRIVLDKWLRNYGVAVVYEGDDVWRVTNNNADDEFMWSDIGAAYQDAIWIASDKRVYDHLQDQRQRYAGKSA